MGRNIYFVSGDLIILNHAQALIARLSHWFLNKLCPAGARGPFLAGRGPAGPIWPAPCPPPFWRIAAEAAFEQLEMGADLGTVTPFWRAIEPDSKLATKLKCGRDFLADMREREAAGG